MGGSRVFCRTRLRYVTAEGEVEVDVRDGRRSSLPGWEECGFELAPHRSEVTDWSDDDQVSGIHHGEIEALARSMTGADVALVGNHIRRSPESARQHQQLSPITFVHSDFAAGYDSIVRSSYYGADRPGGLAALERNGIDADAVRDAERIVILQFWRNVGEPRMDYPLAWCDARTVSVSQGRPFHVSNYAGTGAEFDALGVATWSTAAGEVPHAWYAFPSLLADSETVAFRTYDTEMVAAGSTFFTPHSAFRDPSVPVGRPARSSIELRAICLFG